MATAAGHQQWDNSTALEPEPAAGMKCMSQKEAVSGVLEASWGAVG